MRDRFGRDIEYLRVSVTKKCNLNCIYCSPDDTKGHILQNELLPEEYEKIIRIMANLGIHKVRITGGEPLIREDICKIIAIIAKIQGIRDLSITTNGIYLERMAKNLKDAGLKRINVSLDSLRDERFTYLTGGGSLKDVLQGIERALYLGFNPIKVNTVLIKGMNDDEIDDFIQLAKDNPLEVRFIELMPVGGFYAKGLRYTVNNKDIISNRPELVYCGKESAGQIARYYTIKGYKGKIGFISPISRKFCNTCNRIRLTSDGKIKPCLGKDRTVDLLKVLRRRPEKLEALVKKAIYEKPKEHSLEKDCIMNMKVIGG